MAKFTVEINMEMEGKTVDEAIAKAAVFMVYHMAGYRPTMTVKKQQPFEFPVDREIDIFGEMHGHMFPKGDARDAKVQYLNVLPKDTFPAPSASM